jgi:hypothetical protein
VSPSDTDIAWAAGMFEGEGSMGVYGHNAPRLTVTMKDLGVLKRFQKIVGVGTLLPHANPQPDQ